MISRRLSRYFVSPVAGGVNCACVTPATSGWAGAAAGAGGAALACSAGAASVARRWNSTNAMSCGCPSSVMTKSCAVSPSIGLPSLSFTATVVTIRRVLERKIG